MTGFGLYHSYVIMNVTNRNQLLLKSKIRHYFISVTKYIKVLQVRIIVKKLWYFEEKKRVKSATSSLLINIEHATSYPIVCYCAMTLIDLEGEKRNKSRRCIYMEDMSWSRPTVSEMTMRWNRSSLSCEHSKRPIFLRLQQRKMSWQLHYWLKALHSRQF